MPIFTLESQEGRLFSPLAFTKTFAMAAAALLSVTLVPALMVMFVRGKIIPEHKNPINRFLIWIYRPVIKAVMRAKILVILIALGSACRHGMAGPAARHRVHAQPERGHAALHADHAARNFRHQGRRIAADAGPDHPQRFRKWRRCTARPAAPRPRPIRRRPRCSRPSSISSRRSEWRAGLTRRGADRRNGQGAAVSRRIERLDQPIKARIDMLSTGIRTPVGVKVIGTDLVEIDRLAKQIEQVLRDGAGHLVGLCRARHRRLLPRHRARPRRAGALRHHGPGRAGRHRDRARRPDRDDHGRGPPALRRQHALSARPAQRPAIDRARRAGADAGRRRGAAGRGRKSRAGARADLDPHRERPTRGLRLCRHPRPRYRRLRR